MKGYIADGLAQTEINWVTFCQLSQPVYFLMYPQSLQDEDEGLSLQFYTTDLHTFSRGYAVRSSSRCLSVTHVQKMLAC